MKVLKKVSYDYKDNNGRGRGIWTPRRPLNYQWNQIGENSWHHHDTGGLLIVRKRKVKDAFALPIKKDGMETLGISRT